MQIHAAVNKTLFIYPAASGAASHLIKIARFQIPDIAAVKFPQAVKDYRAAGHVYT